MLGSVTTAATRKGSQLALDIVKPKDDQPRQSFDETALKELAQSIVKNMAFYNQLLSSD